MFFNIISIINIFPYAFKLFMEVASWKNTSECASLTPDRPFLFCWEPNYLIKAKPIVRWSGSLKGLS